MNKYSSCIKKTLTEVGGQLTWKVCKNDVESGKTFCPGHAYAQVLLEIGEALDFPLLTISEWLSHDETRTDKLEVEAGRDGWISYLVTLFSPHERINQRSPRVTQTYDAIKLHCAINGIPSSPFLQDFYTKYVKEQPAQPQTKKKQKKLVTEEVPF